MEPFILRRCPLWMDPGPLCAFRPRAAQALSLQSLLPGPAVGALSTAPAPACRAGPACGSGAVRDTDPSCGASGGGDTSTPVMPPGSVTLKAPAERVSRSERPVRTWLRGLANAYVAQDARGNFRGGFR